MTHAIRRLCIGLAVVSVLGAAMAHASVGDEILKLTGGMRTRAVYVRGGNALGGRDTATLWGIDTHENGGNEREISSTRRDYVRPLITPDGARVVYTQRTKRKCYVVGWDGSGHRELGAGDAADVWRDPDTGIEWVYTREPAQTTNAKIWRHRLDDWGRKELVWDRTGMGHPPYCSWFQLSRDGKRAADGIPWGNMARINLENMTTQKVQGGCWSGMCPDNSYKVFVFNGDHRTINVHPGRHRIDLASAAGVGSVYFPRWSSHPEYMTFTGPGDHGGGNEAEAQLMKFNRNFSGPAGHVRLTHNKIRETCPDAYIFTGPPPPPRVRIDSFTADPASVAEGKSTTLSWKVLNSKTVRLDGAAVPAEGSKTVSPGKATKYTLTADGDGGPKSRELTVMVFDPNALHLKINCGPAAGDVAGWKSDDEYASGGEDYTFGAAPDAKGVTNAAPRDVYRTCRHENHSYSFGDVPDGAYLVRLHFYDEYGGGGRRMDYTIEGKKVLEGFGPPAGAATVREFRVTVSGGDGLRIAAEKGGGNDVFEGGIEIIGGARTGRQSGTGRAERKLPGR